MTFKEIQVQILDPYSETNHARKPWNAQALAVVDIFANIFNGLINIKQKSLQRKKCFSLYLNLQILNSLFFKKKVFKVTS